MKKVAVIGECMVELVSKQGDTLHKGFAGDTYNTAIYLNRCAANVSVSYLTALGDDFLSSELLARMSEEGINSEYVLRSEDHNLGSHTNLPKNNHRNIGKYNKLRVNGDDG